MSELPGGIPPASEPVPRNSASGIVLRKGIGGRRVLMGLRSRKSRFMPGHLAFPGGVMEEQDGPAETDGWARCASREIAEETGLEIPAGAWVDAGERITPPLFPVRFRTRFFVTSLEDDGFVGDLAPASGENERLEFREPAEVLESWNAGRVKLPPPVLPILRSLATTGGETVEGVAAALRLANDLEERSARMEFAPGVWAHPMKTATLPPATHTNVWLVGGDRFVVVDPGTADEAEIERLLAVVARRQELGQTVEAVLLTHHHRDHIGGACEVARRLGSPIRAHPLALEALPGSREGVDLLPLGDGDEIDLAGVTLRAVFTPGHSPAHLAFHLVQDRALVVGDLISGVSTILIDPEPGDMDEYIASLERARALECRLLLPGHGPPLPGGQLAKLIEHRARRSDPAGATWSAMSRLDPEVTAAPRSTPARIEAILRRRFRPLELELRDDSAKHAGHPGATSGGGHYHVVLVSAEFEGRSRVEQHRMVYDALSELIPNRIHALGLTTRSPSEKGDIPL